MTGRIFSAGGCLQRTFLLDDICQARAGLRVQGSSCSFDQHRGLAAVRLKYRQAFQTWPCSVSMPDMALRVSTIQVAH